MSDARRVLVVDDDPMVGESLAAYLGASGYAPTLADSAERALELLASSEGAFAAAICDVALPGMSGVELLRRIGTAHRATAVVMLTGYGTVESAVEALRHGAVDYLTKPVADAELRLALQRAMAHHALVSENLSLRRQVASRGGIEGIIGRDPRMRRVFELVRAVAPSKTTVLMNGESGTGKSLIARAIHDLSPRREKPFVELSCGSIPETLLESELFGHAKGAFTGAAADKIGRFVAADGGTIFLDEINSASPAMQLKLLRVLQERRLEPVGSSKTVEVDVRVLLASNQPLERLVAQGAFRQDLYYRINVVAIDLPPLRERTDDIPMLADGFLRRFSAELGKQIVAFSPEALDRLMRYPFPGNVRELQNAVERAAVLCRGQTVQVGDLPPTMAGDGAGGPSGGSHAMGMAGTAGMAGAAGGNDVAWTPMTLEEALREPERQILLRALTANGWNRQKAADQLGINRTTLYKKLKSLGIEPGERAA